MKSKLSFLFCWVLLFSSCPVYCAFIKHGGDPGDGKKKKKTNAENHIDFLCPRAKFFAITYKNYPFASSPTSNELDRDADGQGHLLKTKLRFPLVLSSKFTLIGEASYNGERIYLPEDAGKFGNIQFQKLGVAFIGERRLENDKFLVGIVSISTKAEKTNLKNIPAPNSLSTVLAYGKKFGDYNKVGFGLSASYNLSRTRISPVVMFNKRIDGRNYIDALLPKSITYRHLMSNKLYFYTSLEAHKSNYALLNRTLKGESKLELRRTEVALKIGLEREIHDWLWMSMNIGLTKPTRNAIVAQGEASRNYLSSFNHQFQPVFSVSLFAVIPQNLINKFSK